MGFFLNEEQAYSRGGQGKEENRRKSKKILFILTMIEKNFRRGFAPRHTPPGAYAAPWTPRELGRG